MITTSPGSHKESVQQEQEYDQFALQQTAKTDACPDNGPEQTLPHDQAAVSDGGDVDGPHDQAYVFVLLSWVRKGPRADLDPATCMIQAGSRPRGCGPDFRR